MIKKLTKKLKLSTENKDLDIFPNYLFGIILTSKVKKALGAVYPAMFCEYWDDSNRWANNFEATGKITEKVFAKVKRSREFSRRIIAKYYEAEKRLFKISGRFEEIKLSDLSGAELAAMFRDFISAYEGVLIYGWLPIAAEGFDGKFSGFLIGYLSKRFSDEKLANEYFVYFTTPKKRSKRQLAEAEIRKFVELDGHNIDKFITEFLKKYQWINYNFQGPVLGRADVLAQINDAKKQRINLSKKTIKVNFSKNDRLYQELFSLAREFMYLKNRKQEALFYSHYCLNKFMATVSERLGLTLKEAMSMTVEEILIGLQRGELDRGLIKTRAKHSVFVFRGGQLEIIVGDQKIKNFLKHNLVDEKQGEIMELKGQVACAGKARGRVKIINSVQELGKMEQEDILVSSKTSPNFMVAMKKAAAIVTDYGGITCHAAIVSRELNKPCIIGTKIATDVLRDGDLVEVDAERGIVKILRRA